MKLAIYNGFPFHHEMFGYIMEYSVSNGHTLDVYTQTRGELGWIKFYNDTFPSVKILPLSSFGISDYDWIILTTDDDFSFNDKKYINVIAIDHSNQLRRSTISYHIGTRPFLARPELNWVIPTFNICDDHKIFQQIHIAVIGVQLHLNDSHTIETVERMMNTISNDNIVFHIIRRQINMKLFEKYNNVVIHQGISVQEMINILYRTSYVLITEHNHYLDNCMSGSIPLAFSTLNQLILPKEMNERYKFTSSITYDKGEKIHLCEPNINEVKKERALIIQHRNDTFKNILNEKLV